MKLLNDYIDSIKKCNNIESYLFTLGINHNEMHNEALMFTGLIETGLLFIPKLNLGIIKEKLIKNIEFIEYNKGYFKQGSVESKDILTFDNEMPKFKVKVKGFSISKYPITEFQYLDFVMSNGYNLDKYWCENGKKWKKKNNLRSPLYWTCKKIKNNYEYVKIIHGQILELKTNLPMCHISWYEAKAYCRWKGVRLQTETEYEFIATNEGKTLYPWGNEKPDELRCNINYKHYLKSVTNYEEGKNKKDVYGLMGNVWEWCEEAIYPYDGFKIDPVYREMSYPCFGYKKICKGGCFAVPNDLCYPRYRNAQYPDCREQFIGFRVCKI